jgi:hypothetical protein
MTVPALSFSGRCRDFPRFLEAIYAQADTYTASGPFGLQGLVREEADFVSLQVESGALPASAFPFEAFPSPGPRPATFTNTLRERDWTYHHTRYLDQCRDVAALKSLIIEALDPSSLASLSDGGISKRSVPAIISYLRTTFSTVPPAEIAALRSILETPYRAGDSIREFTARHTETQSALTLAGDRRTPFSQASSLMDALDQCGSFRFALDMYRLVNTDPTAYTLPGIIHLVHTTHDNRKAPATTADAHYAAETTVAPLTAAQLDVARTIIAAESRALAVSATRRTAPAPPVRRARPEADRWCWTHGFLGHDSADCNRPTDGHNLKATAANRLGGSEFRRR